MSEIRDILKVAAGRLHLNAYLERLHIVAAIVAIVALALVLVEKATPTIAIPWVWTGPGLALLALTVAFVAWLRRRVNELQVAIAVDDRLDLREKLSTALHVARREDAFARAAVEDAINVARDARTRETVRRRFPVEPPNRWWFTPLVAVIAVLAALLIPQGNLFAGSEEESESAAAPSSEVVEVLEATVAKIKENKDLANELKDIFEELDPTKLDPEALKTPDGDRREALKKLSDLSRRLDELQEEKGKTAEALEQAMRQLKSSPDSGLARELTEALAEGNFRKAQEKLQEMKAKAEGGELDKAQREKLAQELQDLADQLNKLAQQQKALEDALVKAGIDPALAQNPQQLQQAIQQNPNLTQQQKQQLRQAAQAQQAAAQMCRGMGQAMGNMAQALGQGQGMGQGAGQMGRMLNDAQALRQMLKQAQAMANQLQGQCQGLGQGLRMGRGPGMGPPGQGAGGEAAIAKTPIQTKTDKVASKDNQADVIANTLFDGPLIKGESTAAFKQAALSAVESYADHVSDDQLPRKYHEAIKEVFSALERKARGEMAEEAAEDTDASED